MLLGLWVKSMCVYVCVCMPMCVYVCVHLHLYLHACFVWIDKSFCCVCVYVVCILSHGVGAVHIYLRGFMYRCVYIDRRCLLWFLSTLYIEECLFAPGIPFLCLPHAGNTRVLPCLLSFDVGPGIWAPVPMVTSHTLYLLNHLSMPSTYLMSHIPMIKNFFLKRLALNANLKSVKHGGSNIFFYQWNSFTGLIQSPMLHWVNYLSWSLYHYHVPMWDAEGISYLFWTPKFSVTT